MSEQNTSSAGTVFVALISGAALGAGLALLFAPQSGRRTRQRLGEMADEAEDYARDVLAKARGGLDRAGRKIQEWSQRAKEKGGEVAEGVSRSAMENM